MNNNCTPIIISMLFITLLELSVIFKSGHQLMGQTIDTTEATGKTPKWVSNNIPFNRFSLFPLSNNSRQLLEDQSLTQSFWESMGMLINPEDQFISPDNISGLTINGIAIEYSKNCLFGINSIWYNRLSLGIVAQLKNQNVIYSKTSYQTFSHIDSIYINNNELIGFIDSVNNTIKNVSYNYNQASIDVNLSYPIRNFSIMLGSQVGFTFNNATDFNQSDYFTYNLSAFESDYSVPLTGGDTIKTNTITARNSGTHYFHYIGLHANPQVFLNSNKKLELYIPLRLLLGYDVLNVPEYGKFSRFNIYARLGLGIQFNN